MQLYMDFYTLSMPIVDIRRGLFCQAPCHFVPLGLCGDCPFHELLNRLPGVLGGLLGRFAVSGEESTRAVFGL